MSNPSFLKLSRNSDVGPPIRLYRMTNKGSPVRKAAFHVSNYRGKQRGSAGTLMSMGRMLGTVLCKRVTGSLQL